MHNDIQWKEQLLHVANLKDQVRLAMHPRPLKPSKYYLHLCNVHNGKLNDQMTNHFKTAKKAQKIVI